MNVNIQSANHWAAGQCIQSCRIGIWGSTGAEFTKTGHVMVGRLNIHWHLFSWSMSGQVLTSLINKVFPSVELLLTGFYFCYWHHFGDCLEDRWNFSKPPSSSKRCHSRTRVPRCLMRSLTEVVVNDLYPQDVMHCTALVSRCPGLLNKVASECSMADTLHGQYK